MQTPCGGLNLLVHLLEREQTVWLDRERVFQFFQRPENLGLVTPPWLRFKILSPLPIDIKRHSLIDYRIVIKGIPVRWRTLIEEYAPPYHFVDEQLCGPYAYWRHEHRFDSEAGATRMGDRVEYALPQWLPRTLEVQVHKRLVRPALEEIFDYRAAALSQYFMHTVEAHR